MISLEDLLYFVDDAVDGMTRIVTELGDEQANRRPEFPGANSPFAILTHCLGVMEFWGGHAIAGRKIVRDRPAEFVASGQVKDLAQQVQGAREQLRADLSHLEPYAPPRGAMTEKDRHLPLGRTQGGALVHIYEELAQHRGQMEITKDLLLSGWARTV
jgi:Protein of unknown function (DUF664)